MDRAEFHPMPGAIRLPDVINACRSLPEPAWHRVLDHHPTPRRAATLVPLTEAEGEAALIITKRARDMEHGGDWVFPGGSLDDDDASHGDAARRETAEELGLDPATIDIIGQLATRGPIVTGFVIEAYVGVLGQHLELRPDAGEVAEVAVVQIRKLLADEAFHRGPPRTVRMIDADVLDRFPRPPDLSELRHYRIRDGEYLWGLQADILHELLRHITDGRHDF